MKVGSQSSSGFEGGGQDSGSEKRKQVFRRQRTLGQEVEGEVLKSLNSGLAWVDVGGLELIAQLPFEPRPGQRLLLRIESLKPEISLKFIKKTYASAGAVQIHDYTAQRNRHASAWQEFLLNELASNGAKNEVAGKDDAELAPAVKVGESFSPEIISQGEIEVASLQRLWVDKFMPRLVSVEGTNANNVFDIQKGHVLSLAENGIKAWLHVPWAGLVGREKEALLVREGGQNLEKMLISGIWPKLGGAFIIALCLNGEISCRVQAQAAIPFEQAAGILNLPGLGQVLRLVKKAYNLTDWPETKTITCLAYKQHPPDTVPAILLRMQG